MKKPVDGCHGDPAAASDVRGMAMSHVDKSKSQHRQSRSKLSDRRISQPINVSVRSASALAYFMLTYFRKITAVQNSSFFPLPSFLFHSLPPPSPFLYFPSFSIPFPPRHFPFLPSQFPSLFPLSSSPQNPAGMEQANS